MIDSIIKSVSTVGLWYGDDRNTIHFLGKGSIVCFLSIYVLQSIALVLERGNVEKLFKCFSVISFCGMGILKLFSLHYNRKIWLSVLDSMSDLEKEQAKRVVANEEYDSDAEEFTLDVSKGIKQYLKKFSTTFTILRRIYRFTAVIYILSPFIEYGVWTMLGDRPLEYPHILPAWTPLDDVHFLFYITVVMVETVAAGYCVLVHIAFDLTAIGIMIFISGQCTILFHQCALIGGRGRQLELYKKRDERAHFRIKASHKTHLLLLNTIDMLNKLMKSVLGVYFLLSTLTLCSVALRLKLEHMSVMEMATLFQYTCATLTQLYLFCSYGDEVLNSSSINPGEGPFSAAIWCLSPQIRRELLLLSIGMLRRRALRAGPFNTVNLPSFIQIVRAAYSCYAVVGQK